MRKTLVFLLSLLLNCSQAAPLPAGWGAGGSEPVGSPVQAYEWRQCADDADSWYLFCNGAQVGGYRPSSGNFRWLAAGQWGEPSQCPFALPVPPARRDECPCCGEDCRCAAGRPCDKPGCHCVLPGAVVENDGTLNFGLSRSPIKPQRLHNGRAVSKARLMEAIGKPTLRDDSGELCLTVIGPEADRKSVLADLASAPVLAPWKDRLKIQGYDPSHWAVRDTGFVTTGKPTIYCQAPDGKVVHRQDEYRGPEALAEVLRKADPSYQPAADPDLNKPAGFSLDSIGAELAKVPMWVWLGIAFALYLKFGHKE